MSGKTKNTNRWGGKRLGSGPKPKYMMSSNQIKKMLSRMRKAKREAGIDEDEFLVSVITKGIAPEGAEADIKERLAAVKIFKDYTMSKHTEKRYQCKRCQGAENWPT